MPFIVEVVCLGSDKYEELKIPLHVINKIQKEIVFLLPPDRLKELGLSFSRREFSTKDIWGWMKSYRENARGQRSYIIAVIDRPLQSEKMSNLFGSHKAGSGFATFTLHNRHLYASSNVAFILYYFLRYSLSFISPNHKSHSETRACFFDLKIQKSDILKSFETGELCDDCLTVIQADLYPEIVKAIRQISYCIKDFEFGGGKMIPERKVEKVSNCEVLLVATTTIEMMAVIEVVQRQGNHIERVFGKQKTYFYLGEFGGARVCLVRSEMGAMTIGGSFNTVSEAIIKVSPNAIIMLGICFGLDPENQPIGHILVSKQLQNYESQKISSEGEAHKIISRGDRVPASRKLLDRFRTSSVEWKQTTVEFCLILSGEKLIDNSNYRDELLDLYPEAGGGEMEGTGLYAASDGIDWIIVKAVCDWADGNKNKNKQYHQELAAKCSAEFVIFTINEGGFSPS